MLNFRLTHNLTSSRRINLCSPTSS